MSEPTTAAEALDEIHSRSCVPDQHDPVCRLLRGALTAQNVRGPRRAPFVGVRDATILRMRTLMNIPTLDRRNAAVRELLRRAK